LGQGSGRGRGYLHALRGVAGAVQRRAFSVAIYAVHEGRVLLVHHKRLGVWIPVGGEVEANETPLEAAARELREETGLEGDFGAPAWEGVDGTPRGLLAYEEHAAGSKGLHLNFDFVARVASERIVSDGSFGEHRWVSAEELEKVDAPRNVVQCARRALQTTR